MYIRTIMSTTTCIMLFIIFSSSLSSTESFRVDLITTWCGETPHPDACAHFVVRTRQISGESGKRSDFRKMVIEAALRRALDVESQLVDLTSKCRNPQQSVVWDDCRKLHTSTIRHLNNTLQCLHGQVNLTTCSDIDAQTWLSSALTNVETCRSGSTDLNVSDFISPMIQSSNLSELITNTLAINGAMLTENEKVNVDRVHVSSSYWDMDEKRKILVGSVGSLRLKASVVVAKDGSGKFKTVQAAIDSAAKRHNFKDKFIIRVKRGVYEENIEVLDSNHHVWLVGDGIGATIITGRRSVGSGSYTTFSSATAGIDGAHFVARGITFRNTAGPTKRQAVALRSASDLAVFYQCSFQGYQDTLFIQTQRQFFRECHVSGTIDFIFGNAAAVFQNCLIRVRRPIVGQTNIITAQGRLNSFEHTGISIHNSRIVPSSELKPVARKFRTYLGRPWMKYSRTVVMKSYLDGMVEPSGWSKWGGSDFGLSTLYFAEYKNFGPGANTKSRVRWKGFHLIRDRSTAKRFTVDGLYAGRAWLPATGVPFTAGL
ncbi:Probable pectinesterase/pectinesterase inhibitor 59 [Linum perenne]